MITCRYLDRYIKPGNTVLDIVYPGRYSVHLAQRGCCVTFVWYLSNENLKYALKKSAERGSPFQTVCGDARDADTLIHESFGHFLLTGPLYLCLRKRKKSERCAHLLPCWKQAVRCSPFIQMFACLVYSMRCDSGIIASPAEHAFSKAFIENRSGGPGVCTGIFCASGWNFAVYGLISAW